MSVYFFFFLFLCLMPCVLWHACSTGECGSEGNVDDELWNEVEPESDPPHEAAVYAEAAAAAAATAAVLVCVRVHV
eukprot:1149791-Pelagomonas_calceolata.AAC.1